MEEDSPPTRRRKADGTFAPSTWKLKEDRQSKYKLFAFGALTLASLLSAVILVGGQVLFWLLTNNWPSVSILNVLEIIAVDAPLGNWASNPRSWLGLHYLMQEIPLFVWILCFWGLLIKYTVDD